LTVEPLFVGHVVEFGFIAGVGAEGTIVFGDDGFALCDEGLTDGVLIPVERSRMATGDDFVGCAVDRYSPPFTVEEIEVEASLLDEAEPIPFLDRCAVGIMVVGVDEAPDMLDTALFADYITDCFHKKNLFKLFKK